MDCDAKEENNCVSTNISTKITECLTDNDKCFTFIDDNQVIRGCLADSDSFFQQTCLSDKQNCVLCASTTCNNQTLTDKCLACDTRFNPECRNKSEREILCSIKVNENEFFGCYTSSFNNIVERGCIENLSLKERQACIDDPEHCKGCIGRNCNTDTVDDQLQCNFCNGSVDGNCANFGGTNTTRICQNGENACFVGIDKFGYTHRKCYAGDETDFKIFEICKRSNCNENIYPANRIKCYQCNATDDCLFYNPDKPNIPATPCQIYDEHDQCFAYVHRATWKVYRGCWSDPTDIKMFCRQTRLFCKRCNTMSCNYFVSNEFHSDDDNFAKKIFAVLNVFSPIFGYFTGLH